MSAQLPSRTQLIQTPGTLRQSSQASFQTVNPPPNLVQQHHTQTQFIPNFAQNTRLTQRTVQNQLQTPGANFLLPLAPASQSSGATEQFPPFTNPARFNQQNFPSQQFRQQASQAPFIASQPIPSNSFTSINQQVQPFPPATQQESFVQIQPSIGNQVETVITETRFNHVPQQTFISQSSIQTSPQFQQTGFNVDRFEREKQKLIQKHEQFAAKQYQKELAKAEEAHKEFLKKQQQIKSKHQELKQAAQSQTLVPTNKSRPVLPSETTYFEKALKQYETEHPTTTSTTTTQAPTTKVTKSKNKQRDIVLDNSADLSALLTSNKDKIFNLLKQDSDSSISKSKSKAKSTKALGKEDLLRQLKLALATQPQDLNNNVTTMDLVLPTGEKVQVIRTSDPELIRRAGVDPSQVITEEAPRTGEFSGSPINLDEIRKNLPPGTDFELVRRTADGREEVVSVPPPKKKVTFVYLEEQNDGSFKVQGVKTDKDKEVKTAGTEVDTILKRIKSGEIKLPPPSAELPEEPIPETPRPQTVTPPNTTAQTFRSTIFNTVTASPYSTIPTFEPPQSIYRTTTTYAATTTEYPETESAYEPSPSETSEVHTSLSEMTNVLKKNGLHAMAKYLKQSGLDSILNETGPYTVFAPTDKAFKSLLVQLGGPDKAEEKFRNNPRLLSGVSTLLLYSSIKFFKNNV